MATKALVMRDVPLGQGFLHCMKANFLERRTRRRHQLSYGVEDHPELGIVFPLQFIEFVRKIGVDELADCIF